MSNFIEKIKAFIEKVKNFIEKFNSTKIGNFVCKMCLMIYVLLMLGGIICAIVGASLTHMGVVPFIAIIFVCLGAIDEIARAIKQIIQ